jgi:hypothetical protein
MLLHSVRKFLAKKRFFSENAIDLGRKLQYNGLRKQQWRCEDTSPSQRLCLYYEKNSPAEIIE